MSLIPSQFINVIDSKPQVLGLTPPVQCAYGCVCVILEGRPEPVVCGACGMFSLSSAAIETVPKLHEFVYIKMVFSLLLSVLCQLRKIYGSKCPIDMHAL